MENSLGISPEFAGPSPYFGSSDEKGWYFYAFLIFFLFWYNFFLNCLISCTIEITNLSAIPRAEVSLLNKVLNDKLNQLNEGVPEVSKLQRDPTSPLYSVHSFEDLALFDF